MSGLSERVGSATISWREDHFKSVYQANHSVENTYEYVQKPLQNTIRELASSTTRDETLLGRTAVPDLPPSRPVTSYQQHYDAKDEAAARLELSQTLNRPSLLQTYPRSLNPIQTHKEHLQSTREEVRELLDAPLLTGEFHGKPESMKYQSFKKENDKLYSPPITIYTETLNRRPSSTPTSPQRSRGISTPYSLNNLHATLFPPLEVEDPEGPNPFNVTPKVTEKDRVSPRKPRNLYPLNNSIDLNKQVDFGPPPALPKSTSRYPEGVRTSPAFTSYKSYYARPRSAPQYTP
ncbi:hypothetical protein PROFUN_15106 [Planoprotostelium fungivorum]|uniref:Uncharacterized protein n=1 Tax=Planoprotostelium fungivorum TaxID=1890364 RepID=A0A2P6MZB6_9EUKA|nr:hypothetical protein PROFUN_15106 [Planoprotostelium fungivorum]